MLASPTMGRSPAIRAVAGVLIGLAMFVANADGQTAQQVCPLAYRQGEQHACHNFQRCDRKRPSPLPYFYASLVRRAGQRASAGQLPCDGLGDVEARAAR